MVLEKNFPFTTFTKTDKNDVLSFNDLSISFDESGYATLCNYLGQNILLVSKLGNAPELINDFNFENVSLVVGHDYVDHLSVLFPSARVISYLSSQKYPNGEDTGFFKLKIT
jgi:hypothetical protein